MPELPDVEVYRSCLSSRVLSARLEGIQIANPFVLRSVTPPIDAVAHREVRSVERLGKRVVLGLAEDLFVVIHLMIAGRLHWTEQAKPIPKKRGLAAFDFTSGSALLTDAGSTKRAAIHIVRGRAELRSHDRGGIEVLETDRATFQESLIRENHTLKRALTDPRLFSGIGNAYSDEILHAAQLSPLRLTRQLKETEIARLYRETQRTLTNWVARLLDEAGDGFPRKVTAFRKGMAVHGRYGQPCPVCGAPVQRIVYATTEVNYCAVCQTGGKVLADRALSKLLRSDWPRTLDEWEDRRRS